MKDDYLKIIEFVINKRTDIIELQEIYNQVKILEDVDYNKIRQLIDFKESRKLGGYAIQLNKALSFLKQELKIYYKNEKRFNRK